MGDVNVQPSLMSQFPGNRVKEQHHTLAGIPRVRRRAPVGELTPHQFPYPNFQEERSEDRRIGDEGAGVPQQVVGDGLGCPAGPPNDSLGGLETPGQRAGPQRGQFPGRQPGSQGSCGTNAVGGQPDILSEGAPGNRLPLVMPEHKGDILPVGRQGKAVND